jgi:hypothetical protein
MENLAKVFEFHKRDNRLTFLGVGIKNKQAVEGSNFLAFEFQQEVLSRVRDDDDGIGYANDEDDVREDINNLDFNVNSEHYKDFCSIYGNLGDVILVGCGGDYIGEYVEDGQSYQYDEDGNLDTTYGVLAESFDQLSEAEQNAIIKRL